MLNISIIELSALRFKSIVYLTNHPLLNMLIPKKKEFGCGDRGIGVGRGVECRIIQRNKMV